MHVSEGDSPWLRGAHCRMGSPYASAEPSRDNLKAFPGPVPAPGSRPGARPDRTRAIPCMVRPGLPPDGLRRVRGRAEAGALAERSAP
jgi:hypothetical protein